MHTLIFLIAIAWGLPSEDLVESAFPGCEMKSHWYSGYLNVEPGKRELHYLLVESEDKWNKDPLVIWFNGGPGCSSLYGLFYENGPCVAVDEDDILRENEFSWTARLNMLYLEMPAGVGYSYS